ncbi:lipopolysaccharide biosynthesis protein [Pelagibacterium lacus]|nr:lipopolysaccharide biosynthesis protein [Pelagibacterium lacus]
MKRDEARAPRRGVLAAPARLLSRFAGGTAQAALRGMFKLAAGSLLARLLGIAALPVLARIYGPEDYGVLSVFSALITLLLPGLSLRYVLAIPLPRGDAAAINLVVLSALLMAVMALGSGVLLWAFAPTLLGLVSMQARAPWWWLIVLGLLGAGSYEILTLWATRKRAYGPVARTLVWQAVIGAGTKIALGLVGVKPAGLLIGQVVTQSGGILSLFLRFAADLRAGMRFVRPRRLRAVARRYRTFPAYRFPGHLFLAYGRQAPLLFVALHYGPAVTGQFGMALLAIALPVDLLGRNMSKAYYAEAARIDPADGRSLYLLTRAVLLRMAALGVVPAAVLLLFGRELFGLVLGPEWGLAGTLSSLLAILMFAQFATAPFTQTLSIIGRNQQFLVFSITRSIVVTLVFVLPFYFALPVADLVLVFSLAATGQTIVQGWAVLNAVRNRARSAGESL